MGEHDVGINLHNEPYPSFENRVCLHLAAGHLVVSASRSTRRTGSSLASTTSRLRTRASLHATIAALQRFPNCTIACASAGE